MTEPNVGKIVVAHPDDEILFFNSVIPTCKKLILCFGPSASETVTEGRKKLADDFPVDDVEFLNIPEANVYGSADFDKPATTSFGLLINRNRDEYEQNYHRIIEALKLTLEHGDTVFTHNPWGEYGHEEHVQVFNALYEIQNDLNLSIFVSGYVSNKSWKLMLERVNFLTGDTILLPTDRGRGELFEAHYQRNGCWTWQNDYIWPFSEVFHKIHSRGHVPPHDQRRELKSLPPLSVLVNGFPPSRGKGFSSSPVLRPIKILVKTLLGR